MQKKTGIRIARIFGVVGLFLFLSCGSLACWPMDFLEITHTAPEPNGESGVFLRAPALLGRDVCSRIVHSVQLTPVIDIYRVQEGRIWFWREKIMSHGAGLPSEKPARGRFIHDPPWMIVEGGGMSQNTLIYRVGTEHLGKNELRVFALPSRELWREIPGKRLVFHTVPGYLWYAGIMGH